MLSSLQLVGVFLAAARVVYSQCNEVGLGGYPSPGEIVYIAPTAVCTFAEAVEGSGNCPTYTDTATLIDPTGGHFVATAPLPNNDLVTIQYPVPTPAGLMLEGVYTLSDYLSPPGVAFFAIITLTHEPIIVNAVSTSTIVTSTTTFTTTTTTSTSDIYQTATPAPTVETQTNSQTTTLPPATVTSTNTITPKAVTKTKYSFTTVTKTITCCPFEHPEPGNGPPVARGHHNKLCRRNSNFDDGTKHLVIRDTDWDGHMLEKRADDPCVPQQYTLRPTATIYTNTVFSTTTVTFTSTETDTATFSTTFVSTLATPTSFVTVTNVATVTPNAITVFTKTRLPRSTVTTTKTITVTKNVKGPGPLHECSD